MKNNGLFGLVGVCLWGVFSASWASSASAADTYWKHDPATPGDWFVAANWTNGIPDTSKWAHVVNGGTAQVAGGAAFASNLWLLYTSSTVAQTGGTMTIANTLNIDSDGACYRLQDGNLACDTLYLGYGGNGCFEQSGGTNTVGYLRNDYGRYTLSGGTLEVTDSASVSKWGTFDFANGSGTLRISGGLATFRGSITNSGATILHTAANTLTIFPEGFDPYIEFGAVTGGGLVHTEGSPIYIAPTTHISGCGWIRDPVRCEGTLTLVTHKHYATICLLEGGFTVANGGSVETDGYVQFDNSASGGIEATGGSCRSNWLEIGLGQTGSFTQEAGQVDVGILRLGLSSTGHGTYRLRGNAQLEASSEYVGWSGTAEFTQESGTNSTSGLEVAYDYGSTGRYDLKGGDLTAVYEQVGHRGYGTFVQTGGTNTVTSDVWVGHIDASTGTYGISAGTLDVDGVFYVGGGSTGKFTVTGDDPVIALGSFIQNAESTLRSEFDSGGLATINVSGTASLDGVWDVIDLGSAPLGVFDILKATGGISGAFDVVNLPSGDWSWGVSSSSSDTLWVKHVPEPASLSLLAAGLGAVWMRKRQVTK